MWLLAFVLILWDHYNSVALVPINWQSNLNFTEQVLPPFDLFILQIHGTPELSAFYFQLIIPSCFRYSHFIPFLKFSLYRGPSLNFRFNFLSPNIFLFESSHSWKPEPFLQDIFLDHPPLEIITPSFRLKSCSTAYHLHFLLFAYISLIIYWKGGYTLFSLTYILGSIDVIIHLHLEVCMKFPWLIILLNIYIHGLSIRREHYSLTYCYTKIRWDG